MEESNCLPPRAQALARLQARFARCMPQLARSPNHLHSMTPVALLSSLLLAAAGACGSNFTLPASSTDLTTPAPVSLSCDQVSITGPASVACTVTLSAAAGSSLTVTLASSNTAVTVPGSVTVHAGGTRAGFTITASSVTTAQTATLTATAGGSSATLAIQLNAVSTSVHVNLKWSAPASSPDPVAGYRVYRAPGGSRYYQLLASLPATQTTYADFAIQSGHSYDYIVKSVDVSGVESIASNLTTATIP